MAEEKTINSALPIATLREMRERAQSLVTPQAWDWMEGGTEREWTLQENLAAFRRTKLMPQILRDVSTLECAVSFLGVNLPFPLLIAPLGHLTQYHYDGEAELARGAQAAGTVVSLSAMTRLKIEEVRAAATAVPIIYQLYFQGPRDWVEEELRRAEDVGVIAICVCADAAVRTIRYREREHRYDARKYGRRTNPRPPAHDMGAQLSWHDIDWLRAKTKLPLIVKGVMVPRDATLSFEHGADAVWVSNHGGRVLDSGMASLDVLPSIREAVGTRPLIFDGGVRAGSDIVRALALGADVVAIGRPAVYGLAADGAKGVQRAFELFREEFESALALCGEVRPTDLGPHCLFPAARG